jgi:hypothetical protein
MDGNGALSWHAVMGLGVREGSAGWFGVCVDSIGLLRQSLGVASKCQTWSYALGVPYGIKGGIYFGLDLLT